MREWDADDGGADTGLSLEIAFVVALQVVGVLALISWAIS